MDWEKISSVPKRNGCGRIIFLTDDLGGGTGNHLLSMIRYWEKDPWEIRIISGAPLTSRIQPNADVVYLPPRRKFNFYPFAQLHTFSHIYRSLKGNFPDIVHAYFFWSILYSRILKLSGKIKTLVENREDLGFGWSIHEYFWLRLTNHLPDRVICVSEAVREVVLDRERIERDRVVVIKNGIESAKESSGKHDSTRKELGILPENLVVGMVANFNRPVKGVSCFLDAVPAVIRAVPHAKFLILGSGNQEQSLKEKARSAGIEHSVIFTGYRSDIDRFYEIFDVSVLTSFSEGLSITLLESMGHGLPVVVTRVGGNPEVVIDGRTGFLVPPGDPYAISERIVKLLLDPHLRRRMGQEGRRRVEQKFQMRHVAKKYLDVYRELIPTSE